MKRVFLAGTKTIVLALVALLAAAGCQSDEPLGTDQVPEFDLQLSTTAATEPAETFLVEFTGSVGQLTSAVEGLGGTVHHASTEIGIATVGGLDDDGAADLKKAKGVKAVNRDLLVQWVPTDEEFELEASDIGGQGHGGNPAGAFFFPCQWNLTQIDAPGAWAQDHFGDPSVKVAVLDTGTDPNHVDLTGRIDVANSVSMLSSPSICDLFAPDQGTFFDFNFHGSFVSGIITSNANAVAGVGSLTTVVGVKVLNCLGSGTFGDIIAGILYAASVPGVEVINMSLGVEGGFPKNASGAGPLVAALNKAVDHAGSKGVLVVSSAGNDATDMDKDGNRVFVPAQSGSGISIWAGDIDGNLASYSNHGRSGSWVGAGGGDFTPGSAQIPLPGCGLPDFGHDGITSVCSSFSLFFGCGSGASVLFNGTGTSFSAPAASGVAALVDGKHGGAKNGGQLRTILSATADDLGQRGVDNTFSHGRVNAREAVKK